ncbi:class I SAM-dependent methyltransferase [Pseudomonadota bacterium]
MLHDDSKKNSRWSDYWEQGFITSFGKAMPDNYSDDVKAFWFRQFEALEDGAVVLDLAAGNGAVAILAVEFSEKFTKRLSILAADAAVISSHIVEDSKALNHYRNKIKFFSSTPCEHLPFEEASVDLVCSQFGIEYSYLPASMPEVGRVLRAEGRFAARMHHQESVIVLDAVRDQSILKEALYEHNIFDILRQYFKVIGDTTDAASVQAARQKSEVVNLERKLFGVVASLKKKYPGNESVENFLGSINRFTMDHIGRPEKERLAKLEDLLNSFRGTIERKQDLQNAAMSQDDMIELQGLAVDSGFKDFSYEKNVNTSLKINGWNVTAHM